MFGWMTDDVLHCTLSLMSIEERNETSIFFFQKRRQTLSPLRAYCVFASIPRFHWLCDLSFSVNCGSTLFRIGSGEKIEWILLARKSWESRSYVELNISSKYLIFSTAFRKRRNICQANTTTLRDVDIVLCVLRQRVHSHWSDQTVNKKWNLCDHKHCMHAIWALLQFQSIIVQKSGFGMCLNSKEV